MKRNYFLGQPILSEKIIRIPVRIVLLLVALLGGCVHAQADSNPFWLGVVRADKTIVPFAMYDGSSWSNPWPEGRQVDLNTLPDTTLNALDRIPKAWYSPLPTVPREWYVISTKGVLDVVTVTRPVAVYSWCETYWGLLIGNAEVPVNTHRVVLVEGMASSEKLQTSPVISVGKDSAEWGRLLEFIRPAFEKAEANDPPLSFTEQYRAALLKQGRAIKTPQDLTPEDRTRVELVLVQFDCVKTASDSSTVLHFEVERDYKKAKLLPERSLLTRSCMEGWITVGSKGTLSLITSTFGFEHDAGGGIKRIIPLGTIVLDGKTLCIVRNRGYEGESYSVLEIGPSGIKVLIDTYGGGC